LRILIYKYGKDGLGDAILLAAARGRISSEELDCMRAIIDDAQTPSLAISGRHLVAAGIKPGPAVSKLLATLEAQWIAEDFPGEARQRTLLGDLLKAEQTQ